MKSGTRDLFGLLVLVGGGLTIGCSPAAPNSPATLAPVLHSVQKPAQDQAPGGVPQSKGTGDAQPPRPSRRSTPSN